MEESPESLLQELLAARERVQRQIDRLQARPYPMVAAGVRTNGVMIDNNELIAKLALTLQEIDESLAGLEPDDASGPPRPS
jgi:hypothetical protein